MIVHSFNGGGIRGLMIAFIMKMSESIFGKAKTPTIYAGTSTGSIIATLRALGHDWTSICKFYSDYGPEIFKRRCIPRILRAKYSDKTLNELLKRYIGENTKIADVTGCILVIPTVQVNIDRLTVWTNAGCYIVDEEGNHWYNPKAKPENALLWEIVRASCSAPRYFNRYKLNGRYFEDGGLKANNPSQIAYNIARAITEEPISILSVTTGRKTHTMKESEYNDGVQVASHVIDSTLDAIDRNTHFALSHQVRPCDIYFRIEPSIVYSSGSVDDTSEINMSRMMQDAGESFQVSLDKLNAFSTNPSKLVI